MLVTDASSDCDMVIGRLLKLATVMSPHLAKIWHEFANWALEMGEKVLASSTNAGRIPLTSLEENRLKETTQGWLNQEQFTELIDLVSQIHLKQIELEAEKTESMRKTLCDILPQTTDQSMIDNILMQWQMIQKRIFYYQEIAARYVRMYQFFKDNISTHVKQELPVSGY